MTPKTPTLSERAAYFIRSAKKIAHEARVSFSEGSYDRAIRKTHECLELYFKGVPGEILDYLSTERIPSFYGADDLIPDETYGPEDAERGLRVLDALQL